MNISLDYYLVIVTYDFKCKNYESNYSSKIESKLIKPVKKMLIN